MNLQSALSSNKMNKMSEKPTAQQSKRAIKLFRFLFQVVVDIEWLYYLSLQVGVVYCDGKEAIAPPRLPLEML